MIESTLEDTFSMEYAQQYFYNYMNGAHFVFFFCLLISKEGASLA